MCTKAIAILKSSNENLASTLLQGKEKKQACMPSKSSTEATQNYNHSKQQK